MNAHAKTANIPQTALSLELQPVSGRLAGISEFLDPAAMPDVYGMVMQEVFSRKGIEAGDVILIDRSLPTGRGHVVLVYLRPDRAPDGLPQRVVAELALSVPPEIAAGSEVKPLLGLYLDDKRDRLRLLQMEDVLAVHRVISMQRQIANSLTPGQL